MPEYYPIKTAISKLVAGSDLSEFEASATIEEIMEGIATPSQIAAFLTAIRMKGVSVDELTTFAASMKRHALKICPKVNDRLVDTCGTGGDKLKTFNISTIAAFVTSGAGVPVAKHGNRSFSSKCGSADLLEKLGVNINADPQTVQNSIEQADIGFMFAPVFHPAMKHVAVPRKEIGIMTMFNILGPLTNPAGAKVQIVGVYDDSLVRPIAQVLTRLGVEDVIVVHGEGGIDEVSPVGSTHVARKAEGDKEIRDEVLDPLATFGLELRTFDEISAEGANIDTYATMALSVLSPDSTKLTPRERATKEMVLMNSSAALVTSKMAVDYLEGIDLAKNAIQSGKALDKLVSLVKYTNGDRGRIESLLHNRQRI
ncbi:MAG: anthranilate phosphoribosyltransferase [Thaumarchaeota archaeon]|nr:anthranilate phosphoribosyltransferase [Nitrososphaerota archaeon]